MILIGCDKLVSLLEIPMCSCGLLSICNEHTSHHCVFGPQQHTQTSTVSQRRDSLVHARDFLIYVAHAYVDMVPAVFHLTMGFLHKLLIVVSFNQQFVSLIDSHVHALLDKSLMS